MRSVGCPSWCAPASADTQLMRDYVRAHPDAATRFAGAMGVQTTALTGYLRTAGYAPPPCQRIVDVGGSRGILLSYLLDILMMTVEAGGERTREDFQTLMASAGYQFSREAPVTSPGRTLPQRVLEFRRV